MANNDPLKSLIFDPRFQQLDFQHKQMALATIDPRYGQLDGERFQRALSHLQSTYQILPPPPGTPAGPQLPVPRGLQGMEQHPYADAAANTASTLELGAGTGMANLFIGAGNLVRKGMNAAGAHYPMNPPVSVMPEERPAYLGAMIAPFIATGGVAEGATLPEQMLAGGLTTGAISSAERNGAVDSATGRDTMLGMVTPLAGAGFQAAASDARVARLINKGLKPADWITASGQNPGMAAVREGIVANDFNDLADSASTLKRQVGAQIDPYLAAHPQQNIDLFPMVQNTNNLITQAGQREGVINDLLGVRKRLTHQLTPNQTGGFDWVPRQSLMVNPREAHDARQSIDELLTYGNTPTANETGNLMGRSVRGDLEGAIEQQVPEMAEVNQRWRDLNALAIAARKRAGIVMRGTKTLPQTIAGTVGTVGGTISGYKADGVRGAIEGGLGGALLGAAVGAYTNPAFLTRLQPAMDAMNPFLQMAKSGALGLANSPDGTVDTTMDNLLFNNRVPPYRQ